MKKNALTVLGVFFASCFLMLLYGGFSWDVFLVDDNVCQWYPITEKAYEQFFKTGVMPSYNFFLLNGFPIANMGYYSLYNPFMVISYLLEKILPFNMFAIYICVLSGLGNVFFFLFCRAKKVSAKHSILFVFAFFSTACFVAYHNWYYAFNNYFIIPLLMYTIFIGGNKKIAYVSSGIILALDVFLGNVQFACFHYMIYLFLMMCLWLVYKSNYMYRLLANVCVGLLLSLPILLLGLSASTDFGMKFKFLSMSVPSEAFYVGSILPFGTKLVSYLQHLWYAAPVTIPFVVGGVVSIYYCVFQSKKRNKLVSDYNLFKESILVFLLILFWVNYNEGGVFAILMSKVPVISKFRYLHKAYFVIIPLMAVYLVFLNGFLKTEKKKFIYVVVLILSIIGFLNNFMVCEYTRNLFVENEKHYLESLNVSETRQKLREFDIQYESFRTASFYSDDSVSLDKFAFFESLNRNYPAMVGAFSLAAYEIAAPRQNLKKINYIYSDSALMTVYGNTGVKPYLLKHLKKHVFELEKQLISNSVKYLLIKRDSIIPLDTLIRKMDLFKTVYVERTLKFNDLFDLIVLGGVPSLGRFEDDSDIPLITEQMDLLYFETRKSGKYVLSFAYNDKLRSYFVRDDGNKEFLDIAKEKDGNVGILNVPSGKRVYLTYDDVLCQWAKLFEIVVSILFVAVLVVMFKSKGSVLKC